MTVTLRGFFIIMEIWKDIPNYAGIYQVSNIGRVKSLMREDNLGRIYKEIILKPNERGGYMYVVLTKNRKEKTIDVHQLVAMSFLNHKPCGMKLVCNHINFNKLDNRADNLEIITHRENSNKKHIPSSSKYTGVCWSKRDKIWIASISINGIANHLGSFSDEYNAHLAYEKALKIL